MRGKVVEVSLSSGAVSKGQESPILAAPKGTGKPQCCIFINEAAMANWCFGVIGTSGKQFCAASRLAHYTHCGLPAHAKGNRKKNKIKVELGAYYVPGGSVHGHPTAKIDPMIRRKDVPCKFLSQFKTGRLTTTGWKDLNIDARMYVDSSKDKDTKDDKEEDKKMGDEGSIPSGFDEGKYDKVEEFKFKWEGDLHQLGGDANWVPTARAHQAAIYLLRQVLNTSSQRHLAKIKALDK